MNTHNAKMFSLVGKRVVLTGAAGFFGRYFASALLEAGANKVHLLDCDHSGLSELSRILTQKGLTDGVIDCVNQNDEVHVEKIFGKISAEGPVDVLINNSFCFGLTTGFGDSSGRVQTATQNQVMSSFESGCWWSLRASQLVAPGMKEKGAGNIINIASMYGLVAPNPDLYAGRDYFNPVGYSMSKAATIAQTRYLAAWLGPEIRVNALAPGAIPNNERRSENSEQNKDEEFVRRLVDRTLLKRVGHPTDLVGPLVFLASDASHYMTGQVVVVDGGWTTT